VKTSELDSVRNRLASHVEVYFPQTLTFALFSIQKLLDPLLRKQLFKLLDLRFFLNPGNDMPTLCLLEWLLASVHEPDALLIWTFILHRAYYRARSSGVAKYKPQA